LFVSKVCNEKRDVLFQLGQILDDVVLVELGVFIVLSVLGHRQEEVGLFEVLNHFEN